MLLTGLIFILLAIVLQYFNEKTDKNPIHNMNFYVKLSKILGIVCIVIGFILIVTCMLCMLWIFPLLAAVS